MQRQKIQCEIVTPSAAAISQADRHISAAFTNGCDHDEGNFAVLLLADFTAKPGKTFGRFVHSRVIAPAFGGKPGEFDLFAGGAA
jgi:hypothetical protein